MTPAQWLPLLTENYNLFTADVRFVIFILHSSVGQWQVKLLNTDPLGGSRLLLQSKKRDLQLFMCDFTQFLPVFQCCVQPNRSQFHTLKINRESSFETGRSLYFTLLFGSAPWDVFRIRFFWETLAEVMWSIWGFVFLICLFSIKLEQFLTRLIILCYVWRFNGVCVSSVSPPISSFSHRFLSWDSFHVKFFHPECSTAEPKNCSLYWNTAIPG